jgi:predicted P-loop ATPase
LSVGDHLSRVGSAIFDGRSWLSSSGNFNCRWPGVLIVANHRSLIHAPRQCIFAGSVNHNEYLRDETGGRRFWPVACAYSRVDELERDRDQIWAEAVHEFRAGSPWWLETVKLTELAEEEQQQRYETGAWDSLIAAWVENPTERLDREGHPVTTLNSDRDSVTIDDVLHHCIGKRSEHWTQADKNQVGRALRALKWTSRKLGPRDKRENRFVRPKSGPNFYDCPSEVI